MILHHRSMRWHKISQRTNWRCRTIIRMSSRSLCRTTLPIIPSTTESWRDRNARTALGHGHKTSNFKRHYKLKNISVAVWSTHSQCTHMTRKIMLQAGRPKNSIFLKWVRIRRLRRSAWSKVSTSEVSTESSFVVETGVEWVRRVSTYNCEMTPRWQKQYIRASEKR